MTPGHRVELTLDLVLLGVPPARGEEVPEEAEGEHDEHHGTGVTPDVTGGPAAPGSAGEATVADTAKEVSSA